ncbi:MAG: ThiF family adenylyltransferase [Bacteroidetes bacterium]|nr:ThiF family adenylyltransferase [Bacteroidota bacterium]
MKQKLNLRLTCKDYKRIINHLFPGDGDEHGLVILAGVSSTDDRYTLLVREIHLANEDIDYGAGKIGYKALSPTFIHRKITRARDQKLVYLAVHNHHTTDSVDFSEIDFESHSLGYPALLQIVKGIPVGALVFGTSSVQADLWLPDGSRLDLHETTIIGNTIKRLYPKTPKSNVSKNDRYSRQIDMFGTLGQQQLGRCHVGIIGLGGIGSLVSEYLSRLGVGKVTLIDSDRMESSNLSRVVGANDDDVKKGTLKVDVAERVFMQGNPSSVVRRIPEDFAKSSILTKLLTCDYLFLAADSMRARLVFNALIHQYLIPGTQMGVKIKSNMNGEILQVYCANRAVRPGVGCLWCNQLIDTTQMAKEAKSDDERKKQAYGTETSNPSVISLNAISASLAVNDFMFDYLELRQGKPQHHYVHYFPLENKYSLVEPRVDDNCPECSHHGQRYALGDLIELPGIEG